MDKRSDPPVITSIADIEAIEAKPFRDIAPASSMYGLIERAARLFGDSPALTFLPDGNLETAPDITSYRELFQNVTRAANLFHSLGVGPGDSIAILAPNIPETQLALWGAETVARACPINVLLDAHHVAELVKASGAKVLVALGPDPDLPIWSRVSDLLSSMAIREVLVIGNKIPDVANARGFLSLLNEQRSDRLLFSRELNHDTPAAMFHTGGTTALPKLAQHVHGNQVHASWSGALYYALSKNDVMLHGFPLFHVAGSFVYGSSCFVTGTNQVLPTRLGWRNPTFMKNFWRFVERHKVSVVGCVPTILATLMKSEPEKHYLDSVRVFMTGGSPLPSELANAFEKKFSRPIRNILGMTESAGLVTVEPFHAPRTTGSTGLRLPFTEVKAVPLSSEGVDLNGRCAAGETGVIVLRGPNVSPGYTDQNRDRGTYEDGWLISGDLGYVDEDGRVFITGRAKDVIIRGAHNIDPAAIEEAIARHPAVEMCAAVGQPDAYAGEIPVAFVTLKAGVSATSQEISAFADPLIAEPPARPKRIEIVTAMPLTAIGKIYKPGLRKIATEWAFSTALQRLGPEADIRIESLDKGGAISVRIICASPNSAMREKIGSCLRDFSIPYEIQDSKDKMKAAS